MSVPCQGIRGMKVLRNLRAGLCEEVLPEGFLLSYLVAGLILGICSCDRGEIQRNLEIEARVCCV